MNENYGHKERIREKFLKNGIESFQEYELLELLLSYVILRKDTKNIAKNLLKKFSTIEKVLKAKEEDLLSIEGIGKGSVSFLKLIGDLPSVLYENKLKEDSEILINNKDNLIKYLRAKIAFENIEKFYVLYLSNSNKLIACDEKASGTLDRSAIYPREIYKDVIKYNAKAVIISHNHPSGNLKPSGADLSITKELEKGLKNFDALLLEHIIISENSYFSFLEEGLL